MGTLTVPTTGTVSGLQNNQDINAALAALATANQGATAPTTSSTGLTSTAGVWWHDTTNNLLKVRDQADANWITVAQFDETNKLWVPVFNGQTLAAALAGMQAVVNTAGNGWAMAGPLHGLKNRLHNGTCAVSQRAAPSLSTSFQYGAVDRFLAAVTAGTVSAGTIAQATAAPVGRTGRALQLAGVTTTGSAVVSAKQRIESNDAVLLKNQNGSVSLRVYQDTGAPINYTITLRKPTAADNYASTTTIATSSPISVPSATDTLITFANQALGDVSNGLEIQVDAACGAVTTKNFYFTEWQVEEGPAVTAFERRAFEQELRDCQRYVLPVLISFRQSTSVSALIISSTTFQTMRTTPTVTAIDTTGTANATGATMTADDARTAEASATSTGAVTAIVKVAAILTADL